MKTRSVLVGLGVLLCAAASSGCVASASSTAATGKPDVASAARATEVPPSAPAVTNGPVGAGKVTAKSELDPTLIALQTGQKWVATSSARAVADSAGNQYVAYFTKEGTEANYLELVVFRKSTRRWSAPHIVAAEPPRSINLVATANGVLVVWHANGEHRNGMARVRGYTLAGDSLSATQDFGRVFDDDWAFTSNGSRAYAGFAGSASQSNNPGHLYDPASARWVETRGVNGRGVAVTSNGDLTWFDFSVDKAKPFGIFSSNQERVPFGYFPERADDGNGYPGLDVGFALPGHGTFMRLRGRQFVFDESKRVWTEVAFSRACEGQAALEGGTVLGSRFEGARWVMCTMTDEGTPRELVSFQNVSNVLVATSGNQVVMTTEDARGAVKLVRFDAQHPERRVERALDLPLAKPQQISVGGGVSVVYLAATVAGRPGLYAVTHIAD